MENLDRENRGKTWTADIYHFSSAWCTAPANCLAPADAQDVVVKTGNIVPVPLSLRDRADADRANFSDETAGDGTVSETSAN